MLFKKIYAKVWALNILSQGFALLKKWKLKMKEFAIHKKFEDPKRFHIKATIYKAYKKFYDKKMFWSKAIFLRIKSKLHFAR